MVEHATENRGVPSSTLGLGTTTRTPRGWYPTALLLLGALAVALAAGACSRYRTQTFVAEGTLAPGDTITVPDTDVTAVFVGVANDSRCATDVTCIRAGDATVLLDVTIKRDTYHLEIVVPREGSAESQADDVSVAVLELRPLPVSTRPIPPGDYRVVIRLVRE